MDSTRGLAAEPALPAPTLTAASLTASSASSASSSASSTASLSASTASTASAAAAASTTTTTTTTTTKTTITASSSGSPLKRPAPSLLPPFEPLSSSPGLPRPPKRQNVGSGSGTGAHLRYPTPVPTSSTGILSSSPPREKLSIGLLERAPLSAVPSIELNENGETLLMGRSSNSSHFQLSANRLISRVHVRARYVQAASPLEASKIEITCNGWNGLKLHCQGRTWELLKGDSFTSETEGTEIMVDVHDARVLIQWPKRSSSAADSNGLLSDASWEDSPPPAGTRASAAMLQASPLRRTARIQSPDSPTPAPRRRSVVAADDDAGIQIYEDDDDDYMPDSDDREDPDVAVSMRTEATASFSSDEGSGEDDESDPDEENDPVVLSFGPYGANISTRLASITTKSPRVTKRSLNKGSSETLRPSKSGQSSDDVEASRKSQSKKVSLDEKRRQPKDEEEEEEEEEKGEVAATKQEVEEEEEEEDEEEEPTRIPTEADAAISNHVVNQLAFSRLSSTPLSTIMHNLPAEQIKDVSRDALRLLIETTPCIGIIKRQGKDAAGKALESEYYYIPEDDTDMQRRAAVVDGLRKPSLRACRKQHKQYYWKRPKTP